MAPASSTLPSWSQHASRTERSVDSACAPGGRGRDVQEAVEEDLERPLIDPPSQFASRCPANELVNGARACETVMHDVPVAVVVLDMEACQPEGRGVGDGARELFERGAALLGHLKCVHHVARGVREHQPGQRLDLAIGE